MKRTPIILWAGLVLLAVVLGGLFFFRAERSASDTGANSAKTETISNSQAIPATVNAPAASPKLVVQYASPPPHIEPVRIDPTPVPVQAVVTRGDKPYSPKFNAGRSERLAIELNRTVPIQLSWPEDTTHSDVFVQAVHGGRIDGQSNNKRFSLAESKTISFTFTPDSGPGTYEIVLRRGTTEEALSFWVPTGNPTDPPAR